MYDSQFCLFKFIQSETHTRLNQIYSASKSHLCVGVDESHIAYTSVRNIVLQWNMELLREVVIVLQGVQLWDDNIKSMSS